MDTGTSHTRDEKERWICNHQSRNDTTRVKKNESKPWLKKMWCIGKITPEYRARMYDLLDLYAKPYDPRNPVICIDEKSKQLIDETRTPLPMKPGRPEKYDYEYKRLGTRNIFVSVEPLAGKRKIEVTKRRTKKDFALFAQTLIGEYREAEKIHIVLDNLNTHFESSFYETLGKREARRVLKRITFHYTPKHASWLDMAEIEINALSRQCIAGRIATEEDLIQRIKSWEIQRNKEERKILWKFTKQDADRKLSHHYTP